MKKFVPIDTAGGKGSIRFTSPKVAPDATPITPEARTAFATKSGAPGSTFNSGCGLGGCTPAPGCLGAGVLGPAPSDDMAIAIFFVVVVVVSQTVRDAS